jgi:hypothetical protein
VTYFVHKVVDVYQETTKVTLVRFRVTVDNFVSPVLTPAQIDQIPTQYRKAVEAVLKGLPAVGEVVQQPTQIGVPTDAVFYDPELAHCCAEDRARAGATDQARARAGSSAKDRHRTPAYGA